MKLRFIFFGILFFGGIGSLYLAYDLNKIITNSNSSGTVQLQTPQPKKNFKTVLSDSAKVMPHLIGLGALGILSLALLLLFPSMLEEERRLAVIKAGFPSIPPAKPKVSSAENIAGDSSKEKLQSEIPLFPSKWEFGSIESKAGEIEKKDLDFLAEGIQKDSSLPAPLQSTDVSELIQFIAHQDFQTDISALARAENGNAVGFILGEVETEVVEEKSQLLVSVSGIWVSPRYRNKGLGGNLLQYAETAARRNGIKKIIIKNKNAKISGVLELALKTEKATAFFLSRGWKPEKRICKVIHDQLGSNIPLEIKDREEALKKENLRLVFPKENTDVVENPTLQLPNFLKEKYDEEFCNELIGRYRAHPNRFSLVRKNENTVGILEITPPDSEKVGGLRLLEIAPELREKGLGRLMVYRSLDLWKAEGAEKIEIFTDPRSAQTFYARCGFSVVEEQIALGKIIEL